MIGLYLHREGLRFCIKRDEAWLVYDHALENQKPWDENWIVSAFELAKADLGLTFNENFVLLVDRPHAYCTAQSVPFGEKQLPQVLENYLEEEIPEDIEDYQFDFRVLHSKGVHSSVLGFWIRRRILEAWCHFADENSLNSLDIQPAESYLLPPMGSEPRLTLYLDMQGQIRYSCLVHIEGFPQLTLGLLSKDVSLEHAIKTFRLQGSQWGMVPEIMLDSRLISLSGLHKALGIAKESFFEAHAQLDPFCELAFNNAGLKLDFRKGEFAQRGILERVIWPAAIALLAITLWMVSLSYKTYCEAKNLRADGDQVRVQKAQIWKKLFPDKRVPESRMASQMEGYYKAMSGQDSQESDSEASSLQVLGRLFSYIKPDEALQIEKVSIGKNISISGTGTNYNHINQTMKMGFKDQKEFEFPQTSEVDRGAGLRGFTFNTKYLGGNQK